MSSTIASARKSLSLPAQIAIDGPVASGKTTVGLGLARRIKYNFLDTGVMYRAVTLLALEKKVALTDEPALTALAKSLPFKLGPVPQNDAPQAIFLDGRDVTGALVAPEVERAVSQVASLPGVRSALVEKQRQMSQAGRIVMIGRDIGTVVLPKAPLKIFLLASAEERARRRSVEREARGEHTSYESVLQDLKRRDKLDSERAVSPLRPADDARKVDTDHKTIEEVIDAISALMVVS